MDSGVRSSRDSTSRATVQLPCALAASRRGVAGALEAIALARPILHLLDSRAATAAKKACVVRNFLYKGFGDAW